MPLPVRPPSCPARPGFRPTSLVQCPSGRQTRTPDAFSWSPKASLFQLPSMEPLIVMQAVAGWPLTVCLSCSSRQPREWTYTPQRPSRRPQVASVFAAVSQAHQLTGLVAKLNSIQFIRTSHATLAWWDHPGVINISTMTFRPSGLTRPNMAHGSSAGTGQS